MCTFLNSSDFQVNLPINDRVELLCKTIPLIFPEFTLGKLTQVDGFWKIPVRLNRSQYPAYHWERVTPIELDYITYCVFLKDGLPPRGTIEYPHYQADPTWADPLQNHVSNCIKPHLFHGGIEVSVPLVYLRRDITVLFFLRMYNLVYFTSRLEGLELRNFLFLQECYHRKQTKSYAEVCLTVVKSTKGTNKPTMILDRECTIQYEVVKFNEAGTATFNVAMMVGLSTKVVFKVKADFLTDQQIQFCLANHKQFFIHPHLIDGYFWLNPPDNDTTLLRPQTIAEFFAREWAPNFAHYYNDPAQFVNFYDNEEDSEDDSDDDDDD